MKKSIILAALIGSIIAFVWSMLSWTVFPWYKSQFKQFKDSEQVSSLVREQATESGIYMLPGCCGDCKSEADEAEWAKNYERGPIMFASVSPKGEKFSMVRNIVVQFVMLFAASLLIGYILSEFKSNSAYGERVFAVTVIGLIIAILSAIPYWNWWHFPAGYAIISFCDAIVMWFLAGLGIAKFAHPAPAPKKKR